MTVELGDGEGDETSLWGRKSKRVKKVKKGQASFPKRGLTPLRLLSGAHYGTDFESGDVFGIGKWWRNKTDRKTGNYVLLSRGNVGMRFDKNQFVKMALSAIGPEVTLYVEEIRAFSVRAEIHRGAITLEAFGGIGEFKNVEYQILDNVPQ